MLKTINFNSDNSIISGIFFTEYIHSIIVPDMLGRLVEFDNVYTNLAGSSLWWIADMRYCEELDVVKVTLLYTKPISVENLLDFKRSFIPELHQLIDKSIDSENAKRLLTDNEIRYGVVESTIDDINEYNMMYGSGVTEKAVMINHHCPEINWWKNNISDIESAKFISVVLIVHATKRIFPSNECWRISAK